MNGVTLTERAAKRTARVVRTMLGETPIDARGRRRGAAAYDDRYQGVMVNGLAEGSLSAPTTATMRVWFPDSNSTADHPPFIESDPPLELTIVNRDPSLTVDAGAYVRAEFLNNEWGLYWVEC